MRRIGPGRNRYLFLLLVLVVAIVFGTGQRLFPLLREAAVTAMMVVIFLVVFDRPAYRYVSLGAGIIGLLTMWWAVVAPDGPRHEGQMVVHLAAVLFFGTAVAMVLRHLFERRAVDLDDILGTMCGYLLSAMAWSNLYSLIELVSPGAFLISAPDQPALQHWYERDSLFLYFSLTTLTTIGYGDVTPVAPAARSAAVLQGVFGQFYIAVVVAQLVGSKLAETRTRDGDR
jgi:hypothetical protein